MFFSWLITLGFMGLTGIEFNIFNIIISSFIFGLGVDYSILMMRGLLYEYKYGKNELATYKVAIFLSSVTTLIGVAALFFAKHPALHSMALIAVVGIISVVMVAYTFQPLLSNWILLDRAKKMTFPVTARIFVKTIVTWGNIVTIAVIMMIAGTFIFTFFPVSKQKKQYLFHKLFSWLCRGYIAFTFPVKRKIYNPHGENFIKPSVIISNHQSLIETPAFLRLYPKILILTGDWIYKNPVFGPIARMAGYINAESGIDSVLDKLKEMVEEGYSILIFPEAHRSIDGNIQRFHRGAFYLSEQLKLDILPILVFGSGDFLGRGWFWGRPNALYMRILPRISPDDPAFGNTVSEKTRKFRRFYIEKYSHFKSEHGTGDYYRRKLMLNYVFKGPVLEWYVRIKMKLEKNYTVYHERLPKQGEILDIGCGYGVIAYMLAFTSEERHITAIDHDEEKIEVAKHCFSKTGNLQFISGDIGQFTFEKKDAFLLSDVLHYLPEESQEKLIRQCIANLRDNGVILIRDANSEMKKRHKRTKLTEFFSTRMGFNKTMDSSHSLYFTSTERIEKIVSGCGMQMEIIDNKKVTSNLFYLIHS
jgi:1-acyl-sn-glycerol-3-phosphate acyltransferase